MTDSQPVYLASGVPGLDEVLHGGVRAGHIYLVEGAPGTGKTTLGLQFLMEGARRSEPCLFVSLAETAMELTAMCQSHGWDLGAITLATLQVSEESEFRGSLFDVSDVELDQRVNQVLAQIDAMCPARVVLDTLSNLGAYGERPARFRRAMETLRRRLLDRGCTVLMMDDVESADQGHPYSIAWGVIRLEQTLDDFGPVRRRLSVIKVRGQDFATGHHDFRIRTGGLTVFPSLASGAPLQDVQPGPVELMSSGIEEIDSLLGGGVERGTSVGIIGPPGSGKSTLVLQYILAAAARGERIAMYLFDETVNMPRLRSSALGEDLQAHLAAGDIHLRAVGQGDMSIGELAQDVIRRVDDGVRTVVLDSLNGYRYAMGSSQPVAIHLQALLRQLNARGAVTFLTLAQHSLLGVTSDLPVDLSYLVDTVIAQRYFEAAGQIHYAISVLKKRYGEHERTIREHRIRNGRLVVGEPLTEFSGVLTGTPRYTGADKPLL